MIIIGTIYELTQILFKRRKTEKSPRRGDFFCVCAKKAVPLQIFFYNGILLLEKIRIYEECKMDDMRGVLGDDDAIGQCTRFNQR